jgi:hypothetical protein
MRELCIAAHNGFGPFRLQFNSEHASASVVLNRSIISQVASEVYACTSGV